MKKVKIWITTEEGEYSPAMGYLFGEGILGIRKCEDTWLIHHTPTGFHFGGAFEFETYREAKAAVERVMQVNPTDWYSTDIYQLSMPSFVQQELLELAKGYISPEEFNIKVMQQIFGKEG